MIEQQRSGLRMRVILRVFLLMAMAAVIIGQPKISAQNQKAPAKGGAAAAVGRREMRKTDRKYSPARIAARAMARTRREEWDR